MAIKVGSVVRIKSIPGATAVVVGDAEGECPSSEECDLAPYEVQWLTVSPHLVKCGIGVGDKDAMCLLELVEV